ncbi:MAG: hypothetical protein QOH97_4437 [Actinoplanes sp.]|nr:hypothetical protein [Actinoplanes sp.]
MGQPTDRRTRRDSGRLRRRPDRYIRVGEKDIFDPANPADCREFLTVSGYCR